MWALLLLSFSANPPEYILTDYVDAVEYNVHYAVLSESVQIYYVQMIFWKDQNVVAWRKVNCPFPQFPFDACRKCHVPHLGYGQFNVGLDNMLWTDSQGRMRKVHFRRFYESWTPYDAEIRERENFHQDLRCGLADYPDSGAEKSVLVTVP